MSKQLSSYQGKVLHVNLDTKTYNQKEIPQEIYEKLLGGKGLGIYFLLQTPEKVDPLSPDNDLIFFTGPLTGTIAPSSDKFGIATKGPATGAFLDSYSSGKFGSMLKHAGFDALILHKKATEPSILRIESNQVSIEPAEPLGILGKSPLETQIILKKHFGEQYYAAVIGLAGELQSLVSSIFFEMRCSGRGGAGAVMGYKNVKAILVSGTQPIHLHNAKQFTKSAWVGKRSILSGEITSRAMYFEGTANIIDVVNLQFGFPTKNFQLGQFEQAQEINGSAWEKNYWKIWGDRKNRKSGNVACYNCPISCSKVAYSQTEVPSSLNDFPEQLSILENKIVVDGPEYETIGMLGSNVANGDKETLLKAAYLCDYYGIDTISTGNIIGFTMELFEKKLITAQDLDGIEPTWGSSLAILDLVRKIGTNEGCGQWLGQGVKRIAARYPDSKNYAMHVKGLELPAYEPRAANGMAMSYAFSDRGACHLHGFTAPYELMGNFGGADPFDMSEKKVELFLNTQEDSTLVDCAVICHFTLNGLRTKEILDMLRDATGFAYVKSPDFLPTLTKRILALTRYYNYREGLTTIDDNLPKRLTEESYTVESTLIKPISSWNQIKENYYHKMGWDKAGKVTDETLEQLEINEIVQKMKIKK